MAVIPIPVNIFKQSAYLENLNEQVKCLIYLLLYRFVLETLLLFG